MALVKWAADTGLEVGLLSKRSGSANGYSFEVRGDYANNNVEFAYRTATGYNQFRGGGVVPGTWTHIACTYDGTTGKIYLQGALNASSTYQSGDLVNGTLDLTIGAFSPTGNLFNGLMTRVCLYNRALTAAEVKRHYEAELMLTRW
jgi:hypothetical protein